MAYTNNVMGKNSAAPLRMHRVHFCAEQLVPESLAIRLELDRLKPRYCLNFIQAILGCGKLEDVRLIMLLDCRNVFFEANATGWRRETSFPLGGTIVLLLCQRPSKPEFSPIRCDDKRDPVKLQTFEYRLRRPGNLQSEERLPVFFRLQPRQGVTLHRTPACCPPFPLRNIQ
jgi:hypothetical protein